MSPLDWIVLAALAAVLVIRYGKRLWDGFWTLFGLGVLAAGFAGDTQVATFCVIILYVVLGLLDLGALGSLWLLANWIGPFYVLAGGGGLLALCIAYLIGASRRPRY